MRSILVLLALVCVCSGQLMQAEFARTTSVRGGGINFNNRDSARFNDTLTAFSDTADTDETTEELWLTNYNFSIPANDYIYGIMVVTNRYISQASGDDSSFALVYNNQVLSDICSLDPQTCNNSWPTGTLGLTTFGNGTFLWNTNLTAEIVNSTSFGVRIRARSDNDNRRFYVDFAQITVYHDPSPPSRPGTGGTATDALLGIDEEGSGSGGVIAAVIIVLLLVIVCVVVAFIVIRRRGGFAALKGSISSAYIADPNKPKAAPANNNQDGTQSTTPVPTPPNEPVKGWAPSGDQAEQGQGQPDQIETNVAPSQPEPVGQAQPDAMVVHPTTDQMDTVTMLTSFVRAPPKPVADAAPANNNNNNLNSSMKPKPPVNSSVRPAPPPAQPAPKVTGWAASAPAEPRPASPQPRQESHHEDDHDNSSDVVAKSSLSLPGAASRALPSVGNYSHAPASTFGKNIVFGVPLAISRTEDDYPVVIYQTINHLYNYLTEEGILRLAGGANEIKKIRTSYNQGENPDLTAYDCHAVGGALKAYLRELPTPLIQMTQGLKQAGDTTDADERLDLLASELKKIPDVHQRTVQWLFAFLSQIAANAEYNKMSPSNLAIVFRPTLKLPDSLIVALIDQYSSIADKMGWAQ